MFWSKTEYVCAVQDFQALMYWCSHDLDRTKAVQRALKVLRVPKGWQTATAHAKTAVAEDNHPRMFTNGAGLALMYRCRQGKVDLSTVLGRHDMLCCSCVHAHGWAPGQHHPGKLCFFFSFVHFVSVCRARTKQIHRTACFAHGPHIRQLCPSHVCKPSALFRKLALKLHGAMRSFCDLFGLLEAGSRVESLLPNITCTCSHCRDCIADQVRTSRNVSGLSLDPLGQCSQQETEQLQAMQQQATAQWHSPGHIGWSIVPVPFSIQTPQLLSEVKLWLLSVPEFPSACATVISSAW